MTAQSYPTKKARKWGLPLPPSPVTPVLVPPPLNEPPVNEPLGGSPGWACEYAAETDQEAEGCKYGAGVLP